MNNADAGPILRNGRGVRWTPDMDAVLMAVKLTPHTERFAGGGGAFAELARRFGIAGGAVRDRYQRLVRAAGHQPGRQWTQEGLWTLEEDDVIRHHMHDDRPDWRSVAAMLGRTKGACSTRAVKLRKAARR